MEMKKKIRQLSLFAFVLLLFAVVTRPAVAAPPTDELFIHVGDALVKSKDENWQAILEDLQKFQESWKQIRQDNPEAKQVDDALTHVQDVMAQNPRDKNTVYDALVQLSHATNAFEAVLQGDKKDDGKEKIKQLLPLADRMIDEVKNQNQAQAKEYYRSFNSKWLKAESAVQQASIMDYGEIEKNLMFIRIALNQEPVDQQKALQSLDALKQALDHFLQGGGQGNQANEKEVSLQDLVDLLTDADVAIKEQDLQTALENLNQFVTIWPLVEGQVQTRSAGLYTQIESQIPLSISLLGSKQPDIERTEKIIQEVKEKLTPFLGGDLGYTALDAALVLLREGLEALLIVSALLSFLNKANQADKQKWIWAGVGFGIVCSALLAVFITMYFSKATASTSREYIEGLTGIVAVVMMFTVGVWLHRKANIQNWNQYINRQLGSAMAKGGLWSMAAVSFFAIFREGAETIIFYAGMAPSMSLHQLLIGIVCALAALFIIGFVLIRFSVRLPIRFFFTCATILIYAIAFKILGVSIHVLQVTKVLPSHQIGGLPFAEWIGFYPSLETVVPQALLLLFIIGELIWTEKQSRTRTVQPF
ncbi:FTR1 family protein [Brevibacillus sp. B_LB10_24]|uniref:FTR1 family iron permease n=1 Tax=Brevibacillus sp. B_LB10_24 TaxID=3380645 RepID=UPI0038BC5691